MSVLFHGGLIPLCRTHFFKSSFSQTITQTTFRTHRSCPDWKELAPFVPVTIGAGRDVSYINRFGRRKMRILQNVSDCFDKSAVSMKNVEKVLSFLKAKRQDDRVNFYFPTGSLSGDRLSIRGGTCTAMSLDFMDQYLSWSEKFSAKDFPAYIEELGSRYKRSNEYFKTIQNGFNGVSIDESLLKGEFQEVRIQSLANYFDLKATPSSGVLDFSSNNLFMLRQDFERSVAKLSDGAHLLRIIRPDESGKQEKYGHSCVVVKKEDDLMFYDPSGGIFELRMQDTYDLFHMILPAAKNSRLSFGRFYHFSPKSVI